MSTPVMVSHMPQTSTQPRTETQANQGPLTREQLREQIRNSVKDATDAAREAAEQAARDGAPVIVHVPPGGYAGRYGNNNDIPPQVVDISMGFFIMCAVIAIGWPLARAFGRRMERRTDVPGINPGMAEQLQRIEQAVDAMSIEVERISESQRFMAKLQSSESRERIG